VTIVSKQYSCMPYCIHTYILHWDDWERKHYGLHDYYVTVLLTCCIQITHTGWLVIGKIWKWQISSHVRMFSFQVSTIKQTLWQYFHKHFTHDGLQLQTRTMALLLFGSPATESHWVDPQPSWLDVAHTIYHKNKPTQLI